MKQKQKKTSSYKFFGILFLLILVIVIINNLRDSGMVLLTVSNNPGVSGLESADKSLICTFQDGRIVSWDWESQQQAGDFKAVSDRAIVLDAKRLAAVNKEGKKLLTVYTLPDGQKQKDLAVGWADQDVWLRIAPDKQAVALVRHNSPDSQGGVLVEFSTLDIEKEYIGSSVPLGIQQDTEDLVDYALSNNGVLYAVGSQSGTGRIAAVDIEKGTIRWDMVYEKTKEFCSVVTAPDSSVIYAGNRDGVLYKISADSGEMIKEIQLLEPGETRPITNDYSVLNLAFSPDGAYYVATINPKAYILDAQSDTVIHKCTPASKLVSKIAFSPDNRFVATSDIRAGYPIKIWPLPQENNSKLKTKN